MVHASDFRGSKVSGLSRWAERIRHEKSKTHKYIFDVCQTELLPKTPKQMTPVPQQAVAAPVQNVSFDFKASYENNPKLSIVVTGISGMGSQLMHLIAQKMLVSDMGRNIWVDDSTYLYKWNANTGLIKGYLTPTFPIITSRKDFQALKDIPLSAYENCKYGKRPVYNTEEDLLLNKNQIFISQADSKHFRRVFKNIHKDDNHTYLYTQMTKGACDNFQFNTQAKALFRKHKTEHNIPEFSGSNTMSVAFHVRRGDKLRRESDLFPGSVYVDKLLEVLNNSFMSATAAASNNIQHCFVATDDVIAVTEIRHALLDKQIHCTLHTLTTNEEHGERGPFRGGTSRSNSTKIVQFLTELSILVDATFFVGTFNSNVGSLAALLRSCVHTDAPHFAHSYGMHLFED